MGTARDVSADASVKKIQCYSEMSTTTPPCPAEPHACRTYTHTHILHHDHLLMQQGAFFNNVLLIRACRAPPLNNVLYEPHFIIFLRICLRTLSPIAITHLLGPVGQRLIFFRIFLRTLSPLAITHRFGPVGQRLIFFRFFAIDESISGKSLSRPSCLLRNCILLRFCCRSRRKRLVS